MKTDLSKLQAQLGIYFTNQNLLKQVFIHRSYLNEHKSEKLESNEKLEFLGDSVLSLITSMHLFKSYPQFNEGEYTDIKAAIVRTESLYEAAQKLHLGTYLYLSRGEIENDGINNMSILADCFEALLGAIFLEHGFEKTVDFIKKNLFQNSLETIISTKSYLPAKNRLQEFYQSKYKILPHYVLMSDVGPQHNKLYTIAVFGSNKKLGIGIGKSKKIAEEKAAEAALQTLGI